jgi:hypothetical protein
VVRFWGFLVAVVSVVAALSLTIVFGVTPLGVCAVGSGLVAVTVAIARPYTLRRMADAINEPEAVPSCAPAGEREMSGLPVRQQGEASGESDELGVVPDRVLFAEHAGRRAVVEVDEHRSAGGGFGLIVGLGPGRPVVVDLAETGHVLVAGPAGSGRTATVRLLVAQAVRAGARCSIIDPTGVHADWVDSVELDGVELWGSPMATGLGLAHLAWQREQDSGVQLVVIEDLARTLLADLGAGSPGEQAIEDLLASGRGARVRVIAATSARPPAWVADRCTTQIVGGRGPVGRVQVLDDLQAAEAQVIYMTDAEAGAWAGGGHADFSVAYLGPCPSCGEPYEADPWAPVNRCLVCEPGEGTER